MDKGNILICGHRSFAAKGLDTLLRAQGYAVDCFSRGDTGHIGYEILGDVLKMAQHPHLQKRYDVIINFIIIKGADIETNLAFARAVNDFCEKNGVKRLVIISSISVYPNEAPHVNEHSPIENNLARKGGYARIKVAIDRHFMRSKQNVTFVRPGFIVADGTPLSLAGILKPLPMGFGLLLGGHQTPLPLLEREVFHHAVARLVGKKEMPDVCLMFSNRGSTKLSLAREIFHGRIIVLPTGLVRFVAAVAYKCRLLSFSQYHQVLGLFKSTRFDSTQTEKMLGVNFR